VVVFESAVPDFFLTHYDRDVEKRLPVYTGKLGELSK
jgi:hypothetical protein